MKRCMLLICFVFTSCFSFAQTIQQRLNNAVQALLKQEQLKKQVVDAINAAGIKSIKGNIVLDQRQFSYQPLPGGWIWDDIGNYYGAGTWALNWNENQYDLVLKSGKNEGDKVSIIDTS